MSPADGIRAILEAAGICGGATTWDSRTGALHTSQDRCVAVLDSGGRGSEVKIAIDYPTVQILVRADKNAGGYVAGYDKARECFIALQAINQNPAQFVNLTSCVVRGGITPVGRDDNDRPVFSLNFNLIVTIPGTEGYRDY
jgi:Bacteriophage minor capsid protein